jgi:signal transduction histidine kinase
MDQFSEQLLFCLQEISTLQEASDALGQSLNRENIAQAALARSIQAVRAARGAFFLVSENGWERLAVEGDIDRNPSPEWVPVLRSRSRPLICNYTDVKKLPDVHLVAPGFSSLLVVPVIGQGQMVGILTLFDASEGRFLSGDAKTAQAIGKQAGTALNNEAHHRRLLHAQEEILVSQKLASMGEMAAEIGHELNNYLTTILGQTQIMQVLIQNQQVDEMDRRLESLESQVKEMAALTQGLMKCAHEEINPVERSLADMVQDAISFAAPQPRYRRVTFRTSIPKTLPPVFWDPVKMQQVFVNLFNNAADAMVHDKRGSITIGARLRKDSEWVDIRISDTGPGIPEDIRQRIFEPRFTTRRQGNGFGLTVCFRIIQDHGGSIRLEPPPSRGTAFTVSMPVRPKGAGSADSYEKQ